MKSRPSSSKASAKKSAATRRFFKNEAELRSWLERHHATETELLIGFYKSGTGKGGLTYKQALDQSLCFGWIDGVRRGVDDESYEQRFTPRKPRSHWSQINIKRAEELEQLGLMMPAGRAEYEKRAAVPTINYSYEMAVATFSPDLLALLKADKKALAFFEAQPPGYRRHAAFYVMSAKREETRRTRMARLIADCRSGRRLAAIALPSKKR